MKNRIIWAALAGLILLGVALGVYFAQPRPTYISGDAWDYAVLPMDVPEDWRLADHGIITAHDIAQEGLETSIPISTSASLQNVRELYYARYEPPELSQYFDLSLQVLVYQTQADAAAALAEDAPRGEWEQVEAPQIGEGSQVWHFINPDPTLNQNIYRVDFRYLNGVGSVTMMGTTEALPDSTQPASYAEKILSKMRSAALPKDLGQLQTAQLPDLREVLLSQDQLAELDEYKGGRWQVDARSIPQWTPTDSFDTQETRDALKQLGRITGYQMFLVKALSSAERPANLPEALFQQVTVYKQPDSARTALGLMVGIEQVPEVAMPSPVGDESRLWSGVLQTTKADGSPVIVAVQEIDFRVGQYVGSIRLQSRPLATGELEAGQAESLDFALKLAEALAGNMRAANARAE